MDFWPIMPEVGPQGALDTSCEASTTHFGCGSLAGELGFAFFHAHQATCKMSWWRGVLGSPSIWCEGVQGRASSGIRSLYRIFTELSFQASQPLSDSESSSEICSAVSWPEQYVTMQTATNALPPPGFYLMESPSVSEAIPVGGIGKLPNPREPLPAAKIKGNCNTTTTTTKTCKNTQTANCKNPTYLFQAECKLEHQK